MNYLIQQTQAFTIWHSEVRDLRAKIAIGRRIERASVGNLGDIKTLSNGISEMRIDIGVGYRIYFTLRGGSIVILLVGGDKSSQDADIRRAKKLAKEI